MKRITLSLLAIVAAVAFTAGSASANNLLTNGAFQSGDLTGWTVFTTSNGSNGPGAFPFVSSFDVTGGGAQNAAQFQVGIASGPILVEGGGGLYQDLNSGAGMLDVSFDFASEGDTTVNST